MQVQGKFLKKEKTQIQVEIRLQEINTRKNNNTLLSPIVSIKESKSKKNNRKQINFILVQ